jgi:hypothetical protein
MAKVDIDDSISRCYQGQKKKGAEQISSLFLSLYSLHLDFDVLSLGFFSLGEPYLQQTILEGG